MDNIVDLTDSTDSHDVLHSTGSGGLIGGQLLSDRPLAAYLHDDEDVQYVLRNKKSGLEVVSEAGVVESVEPGSSYQTLAAVTDRRFLVVAGQSSGNETRSLSFIDVFEARTESSGLRKSTLEIETVSGDIWKFPCKADPATAAAYIEDIAQTWANADRLLEDAEGQIETATTRLDDGDQKGAAEALTDAEETIDTARQRIQDAGPGPRTEVSTRADEIKSRLSAATRRVAAARGASAHAAAQSAWSRQEYEKAATNYETAVTAYETARDQAGETPDDETLARRLRGASGERELLRVGPAIDADAARRKARSLAEPEEAAEEWEIALDSYRDMLSLDWGTAERTFVADKQQIKEQAMAAAGDAIADHREAGREWLSAGDELSLEEREGQAEQVYERAKDEFERAHRLAKEVRPERADALAEDIDIAERRLEGEGIPAEESVETVLPSDGDDDEKTDEKATSKQETANEATDEEPPEDETSDEPRHEDQQVPGTTTTAVPRDSEGSLIDRLQSSKQQQSDTADEGRAADTGPTATDDDTPDETATETVETGPTSSVPGTEATEQGSEATTGGVATTAATESEKAPAKAKRETVTPGTGRDDGPTTVRSDEGGSETDGQEGASGEKVEKLDEEREADEEDDSEDAGETDESGEIEGTDRKEGSEGGADPRTAESPVAARQNERPAAGEGSVPEAAGSSGTATPDSGSGTVGIDSESETVAAGDSVEAEQSPGPAAKQPDTADKLTRAEIQERLTTLEDDAFTELVADIWEAQGWSTTVFSATAKAVYDIMAMRQEPEEHRLLLWTVHRPDGGALGATVIKRCATARDSSQGADSATLVTTGTLTDAAQQSVDDLGVTVVDSEKLAELIRFESLEDRVLEATDAGSTET